MNSNNKRIRPSDSGEASSGVDGNARFQASDVISNSDLIEKMRRELRDKHSIIVLRVHEMGITRMEVAMKDLTMNYEEQKEILAQQHAAAIARMEANHKQGVTRHNDLIAKLKHELDVEKTAAMQQNDTINSLRRDLDDQKATITNFEEMTTKQEASIGALGVELGAEKEQVTGQRDTLALQRVTLELKEKVIAGLQAKIDLADTNAQSDNNTKNHELAVTLQGKIIAGLEAELIIAKRKL